MYRSTSSNNKKRSLTNLKTSAKKWKQHTWHICYMHLSEKNSWIWIVVWITTKI